MAKKQFNIDGQEISIRQVNSQDYLSLTDMAKVNRPKSRAIDLINSFIRNNNIILYLEAWEEMHNDNFKVDYMNNFKLLAFDARSQVTIKRYVEVVNPMGIESRSGRYGGTFAHIDIAFEFAMWLDPKFKVRVIKDYQRLKQDEAERLNQEYDQTRFFTKINYTLQTKAIQENIIPRLGKSDKNFAYANEADMLNLIVFGKTSKQWKEQNPEMNGNLRDQASVLELNILNNLQSRNSELIDNGVESELRFRVLLQIAQKQFERLGDDERLSDSKHSSLLN